MLLSPRSRIVALGMPLVATVLMSGCTTVADTTSHVTHMMSDGITKVITPYKVEIVQGNVVTKEEIAQISPGKTRNDVRDVLGTPLLADPFHANRWDYIFTIKRQGMEPQKRMVTIWFEGDVVKSVDKPELPSENEFVASISHGADKKVKEPKLMLSPEERAALPVPKESQTTTKAPEGATRSYPPLETL
jgi:outer membrane protein assembly factor BamE